LVAALASSVLCDEILTMPIKAQELFPSRAFFTIATSAQRSLFIRIRKEIDE
jgi:hypothetical protein